MANNETPQAARRTFDALGNVVASDATAARHPLKKDHDLATIADVTRAVEACRNGFTETLNTHADALTQFKNALIQLGNTMQQFSVSASVARASLATLQTRFEYEAEQRERRTLRARTRRAWRWLVAGNALARAVREIVFVARTGRSPS
jgi:hypothetical protein